MTEINFIKKQYVFLIRPTNAKGYYRLFECTGDPDVMETKIINESVLYSPYPVRISSERIECNDAKTLIRRVEESLKMHCISTGSNNINPGSWIMCKKETIMDAIDKIKAEMSG